MAATSFQSNIAGPLLGNLGCEHRKLLAILAAEALGCSYLLSTCRFELKSVDEDTETRRLSLWARPQGKHQLRVYVKEYSPDEMWQRGEQVSIAQMIAGSCNCTQSLARLYLAAFGG
jgi:hypothetical protein